MLSFTHNSKTNAYNINQLDFQPLVISNKPPLPITKNPQKKIVKAVSHNLNNDRSSTSRSQARQSRQKIPEPIAERDQWKQGGKITVFDPKVRKNQLAQEERRIRAEGKRKKNEVIQQLITNQRQIKNKTIDFEKQQEAQIAKLKKLIEQQKKQKQKNDKLYEIKLKEIERQRNQLLQLERKIQQNGVKNQKQFKRQMNVLLKNEVPANDRAKCHQEKRQLKKNEQITQSEVNHKYNALRQNQLQLLTKQRQKCLNNQPTLNYNPTIIPLLSRASYKIISTHISTLVQLFIDDLLEEQVYLLEQMQLMQQKAVQEQKQKQMISDYYQKLYEFVDQAEEIQSKVGRYTTMKFQDLYIPKKYEKQSKKNFSKMFQEKQCQLKGLQEQAIDQILSRKNRSLRFLNEYDHYKKGNLQMFNQVTQEIINQALIKMAKQLDKGSNDFVEVVFRKQFE